jgi:hypothetical protein
VPQRILRDGILESQAVASLTAREEVLYRRLMSAVDDYGRFHGDPRLVRARCYPLTVEDHPLDEIEADLKALSIRRAGIILVMLYEVDGKKYLQINNFGQRIQAKSKFPEPPTVDSTVDHGEKPLRATRARSESESDSETKSKSEATTTTRARGRHPVAVPIRTTDSADSSSSPNLSQWPKTLRAVRDRWEMADEEIIRRIIAAALDCADARGRPLDDGSAAAAVARGWRRSHQGPAALLAAVPAVLGAWFDTHPPFAEPPPENGSPSRAIAEIVTRPDGTVDWDATDAAMARGHPRANCGD